MSQDEILAKCLIKLMFFEIKLTRDFQNAIEMVKLNIAGKDVENLMDELLDLLNHIEYSKFMKSHGLFLHHPERMTEEERLLEREIIENNFDEFRKIQETKFKYEDLQKVLNKQINNLLKL